MQPFQSTKHQTSFTLLKLRVTLKICLLVQGGKAGWDQRKSAELKQNGVDPGDGPGDEYMLQVRGLSILNTKAIQVPMSASSLNSNDTFVIFTRNTTYIWNGKVRG